MVRMGKVIVWNDLNNETRRLVVFSYTANNVVQALFLTGL